MDVRKEWKLSTDSYYMDGRPTYSEIVAKFGEVLLEESDSDYQGDSLVLLRKAGRIGHLTFGWGSCSGCDSLEAANTPEELQGLVDELEANIRWFDSTAEAEKFMREHDWEGQFCGDLGKLYAPRAIAMLAASKEGRDGK